MLWNCSAFKHKHVTLLFLEPRSISTKFLQKHTDALKPPPPQTHTEPGAPESQSITLTSMCSEQGPGLLLCLIPEVTGLRSPVREVIKWKLFYIFNLLLKRSGLFFKMFTFIYLNNTHRYKRKKKYITRFIYLKEFNWTLEAQLPFSSHLAAEISSRNFLKNTLYSAVIQHSSLSVFSSNTLRKLTPPPRVCLLMLSAEGAMRVMEQEFYETAQVCVRKRPDV